MKFLFAIVVLLLPLIASGQNITTVAGNGTSNYYNSNSNVLTNGIGYPMQVAFDKSGGYYFGSYDLNRVFKVDNNGTLSCIAGTGVAGFSGDNGLATLAQLRTPVYVAIDSSANIYISDCDNHRVRKIDHITGIITTYAGSGPVGSMNGSYSGDSGIATNATFNAPFGLCFDSAWNLLISDSHNNRIRKVNAITHIVNTIAGNGITGFSGDNGLASNAEFYQPSGICFDNYGNLIIGDAENSRVRMISTTDTITTIAGNGSNVYNGDSILAVSAGLFRAYNVAVDKSNRVYVSDMVHNRIRMIDTMGIIYTVAGTGVGGFGGDNAPAINAQIYYCHGISFDECGNLYISDFANSRIRKVWFNTDTLPHSTVGITPNDTVITGTQVTTTAIVNTGTITACQWVKNGIATGTTTSSYTFTPTNGDSIYCIVTTRACTGRTYTDTTLVLHITVTGDAGVANTTNSIIHTYPNPVTDVLHVTTTELQHYVLHNLMGVVVLQGSLDKQNSIDMKAIPSGIYLLQLTNQEGQRTVLRVVKE